MKIEIELDTLTPEEQETVRRLAKKKNPYFTDDKYSLGEIGRYERDCITNALKYAPTIDAEPVKHGHWIDSSGTKDRIYMYGHGYFKCSVCGQIAWLSKDDLYCRNCGAKMDEEAEE